MVRETFAYLKSMNYGCDNKSKNLMLSTAQFKLFSLKKIRKNFTIDYCVIENIVDQLVQKPTYNCHKYFSIFQNCIFKCQIL